MALRIVVAFATDVALGSPGEHLRALRALRDRAEPRGGRLCALDAQGIAFDFAPEDLEEALSLAVSEHRDGGQAAPGETTRWSVGIAEGDMTPLADVGSLALPSWGVPLVVASLLARRGEAGEVLVDRELGAVQAGELLTWGARDASDGSSRVHGMLVDVGRLWRRDEPGRDAPRPVVAPTREQGAPSAALGSLGDDPVEALRGEVELSSTVRRLAALGALARGDVGEALVTLQTSLRVEHDAPPEVRSRGWLALALGLGVAGRRAEALFAALEALARAREAGDAHGERACLRFLAKLSLAAGHSDLSGQWEATPAPAG